MALESKKQHVKHVKALIFLFFFFFFFFGIRHFNLDNKLHGTICDGKFALSQPDFTEKSDNFVKSFELLLWSPSFDLMKFQTFHTKPKTQQKKK